jgi:hypothetical protein
MTISVPIIFTVDGTMEACSAHNDTRCPKKSSAHVFHFVHFQPPVFREGLVSVARTHYRATPLVPAPEWSGDYGKFWNAQGALYIAIALKDNFNYVVNQSLTTFQAK